VVCVCFVYIANNAKYTNLLIQANENMDLHLYKLTADYRNIAGLVTKLFGGNKRQAPCLIKMLNVVKPFWR
jgi:hypothetical protein